MLQIDLLGGGMDQEVTEILLPSPGNHRWVWDGSPGQSQELRVPNAVERLLVGLSEAVGQVPEARVERDTEEVPPCGRPLVGDAQWGEGSFPGQLRSPGDDCPSVGQAK